MARRISGRSKKGHDKSGPVASDFRPSREQLLAFINENPDQAGKREIARAFGLKGPDRVWLKDTLRALEDEGLLERKAKKLVRPGGLPHVVVLDIFGRGSDGELLARPSETRDDNGPAPLVAIRMPRGAKGRAPGVGERVLAKVFPVEDAQGPAYTARVLKIIDKRRESVLGVVRVIADGSWRLEPVERRQAEYAIDADHRGDASPGDLVEAEPISAGRYGLPRAKVTRALGRMGDEKSASLIAIHAHEIPHIFPESVLEEAETAAGFDTGPREDWRNLPLITIDPSDARDHDDAVHAEPDEDERNPGGVIVTVAIADVAAYVRPDSAMDREAQKRGNSVYFPDRVVPMLPERISNDLCSLREGEDRPALAVRMVFAADGRKLRHTFHRIVMRSAAKLSYSQAQTAIDGAPDEIAKPHLETVLKPLWEGYRILKRGRESRQPLELDLPERRILLKEDGTVDRVFVPERLDAHKLIEECMIQANVAAAETLEAKRQKLVYRIHDSPSLAKQEALREFLQTIGISLARGAQLRPKAFNAILERVEGTENDVLVNEVVLRSQSQAAYETDNIGHFGLNLHRYAHFTSPIRRYADLIVHRALIAALGLGKGGITQAEEDRMAEVAALISAAERRAMAAERDTVDRLVAAHLSGRIGEVFEGRVAGVTKAGLFVKLPDYAADGFVPVSTLGDDYYIYDEASQALAGERSGRGYRLADPVEIRLAEVVPLAGSMRFEMLTEPKPLPGTKLSFHKAKGKGRVGQKRRPGQRAGRRK
ncbi:ribonuclease R [Chelativorans sp. ZYF759]|nr:ribonuclease R [Chelativorans sp. ZYF759]NMG39135.1 ribonuclease R [Chelativorans sp. ZYF759]